MKDKAYRNQLDKKVEYLSASRYLENGAAVNQIYSRGYIIGVFYSF